MTDLTPNNIGYFLLMACSSEDNSIRESAYQQLEANLRIGTNYFLYLSEIYLNPSIIGDENTLKTVNLHSLQVYVYAFIKRILLSNVDSANLEQKKILIQNYIEKMKTANISIKIAEGFCEFITILVKSISDIIFLEEFIHYTIKSIDPQEKDFSLEYSIFLMRSLFTALKKNSDINSILLDNYSDSFKEFFVRIGNEFPSYTFNEKTDQDNARNLETMKIFFKLYFDFSALIYEHSEENYFNFLTSNNFCFTLLKTFNIVEQTSIIIETETNELSQIAIEMYSNILEIEKQIFRVITLYLQFLEEYKIIHQTVNMNTLVEYYCRTNKLSNLAFSKLENFTQKYKYTSGNNYKIVQFIHKVGKIL